MSLSGQVALVTGASGPIGGAIAARLDAAGARVALQYGQNRPAQGGACFQADLGEPGFETELLGAVTAELGAPDLLIHCAADQSVLALGDMSDTAVARMMRVNVGAVLALTRAFVAQIPARAQNASVINISSIEASNPGGGGHAHYAASKAALESLTRSFAMEYGAQGVRANAVAPGLIARPDIETRWPEGVARWQAACPLGRMGTPKDVAEAVLFLASPAASWINGTVLTLDGGVSAATGW